MSTDGVRARIAALRASARALDAASVAWLIDCFDHPAKAVQRGAADVLVAAAGANEAVAHRLRAALGSASLRRRWVAAWTLARLGPVPPQALAVLFEVLGSADGDLRWAAARIVTRQTCAEALAARLARLAAQGGPAQRKMALYCLRDLGQGDEAALAAYRRALGDPDAGVRLAAMSALVRCAPHEPAAAAAVAEMLADADAGVRRAAAASLGRFGCATPDVRTRLAAAAASEDAALARAARTALVRLDG